eukprot:COSAG02_NODE_13385_length_1400_cov_482.319754_1_plen_401_part_00
MLRRPASLARSARLGGRLWWLRLKVLQATSRGVGGRGECLATLGRGRGLGRSGGCGMMGCTVNALQGSTCTSVPGWGRDRAVTVQKAEVSTPEGQEIAGASKRKAEDVLQRQVKLLARAETPESHAPSQDARIAALQPTLPLGDGQLQGLLGLLDLVGQDRNDRAVGIRSQPPASAEGTASGAPLQVLSTRPLVLPEPTPQIRPPGFPRRNYKQPKRGARAEGTDRATDSLIVKAEQRLQTSACNAAAPGDTRPRPFACQFAGCGYTATKLRYVTEHERTHTGAKPYQCTWEGCNYRSSGSGHMARHMRIHTGDRPYRCTEPGCDYAASQSGHLRTHTRKHTGERPFKCLAPGCSYAASRAGHLRRHMKVHETVSDWHSSRGYPRVEASAANENTKGAVI